MSVPLAIWWKMARSPRRELVSRKALSTWVGWVKRTPGLLLAREPILNRRDLLVQSAIGSGKTKSVLAPTLERVIQSGREEAVICVVPTRALAIDLRRRLRPTLHDVLELRWGVRTGDVKQNAGGQPDLLITTPESLTSH